MLRLLIIFKISQASLPYYLLSGLHNLALEIRNDFQVGSKFWEEKSLDSWQLRSLHRFVFSLILVKDIQVWKHFQRGSLKIHVVFIEERTIQAQKNVGQEEKEK